MIIQVRSSHNVQCPCNIDHEGKWVFIEGEEETLSLSPAEAKAIAAALVHYAERAQTIRDREDAGL